jgi:hypothetical protein
MNRYLEGFGGGGDPFWLHRETLTFMDPAAYQNGAWENIRGKQNLS